ncbi:MAG: hypothetical protein ACR2PF_15765 [Rhizobiaceae bacterium]
MRKQHTFRQALIAALAWCLQTTVAIAADLGIDNTSADSDWEVSVAPFYGWLPGFYGDVAVFGSSPVSVSVSPIEVGEALLDSLDFAVIGSVEMRRENYGVFLDLVHMNLSSDDGTPGPLFSSVELATKETMFTAMGSWRAIENPQGHLDFVAGARL